MATPLHNDLETKPGVHRQQSFVDFLSKSRNSIYLVVLSIFEALVVIALEAIIFKKFYYSRFSKEKLGLGIPVYLMIFIFSQAFQVFLGWDAVRNQNTIQIIAFTLFNLCCFTYAMVQFRQMDRALKEPILNNIPVAASLKHFIRQILIANAVVIAICEVIYIYLAARLYQEFGWRIYKKIGADPEIRNMYRWYQIFVMILKLDIFFFLGYSIQYLVLVLQLGDMEYPLTIIALPVTCLVLVSAVYAVRHESKNLMILFFIGLVAGIAYFVFKLARIYDPGEEANYRYFKEFLTFFGKQ
ncbi:uncharacterized protein BYT42DRAFT_579332 [Radiomyces spectabilis]|uniref:uncharacterized protein n=1 Tax=Radiomyces spectabilis TaxID=64574 RepID=UPI00221F73C0|nr:uncharacterized protein BYT42DRAFT_579332 [Radiomyces spectabilis]KAI8373140.1 hypothetical protein BYT42DRAFT_579332 [Radiomyces spectabilis]